MDPNRYSKNRTIRPDSPWQIVQALFTLGLMDSDKIGIAVRKGDTKLRDDLNKALAEIKADGTYKKINDKYFPFSIE